MKKKLFIFAAAFAAILSSCAKQELVNPAEDQTEFNAFIEESDQAKTALGAKNGSTYPLTWSAGDRICVNGQMSDEISSGSGTKNATFKVGKLGTATAYNVTYPGKLGSDNVAAFPTSVSLSAPVLPMYAAATSRSFTMTHLAAVLKLSFTSATSLKINSIELTTPGGEALGGEMTIGKTGTAINGSLSGGQSSISVDCGSGISLSSTATSVMIPVPARTYSKGIKITLTDSDMGSMVIVVLNDGGVATAGKVLEFNTVAYVSDISSEDLYLIYDTATLQSFVSAVNGGSLDAQSKGAKVTADFTVSSSAAESLAEVAEYYGVFDGNNKTITGLKKPLFNTLYGQIKNLTLNSTVSISNDETYGTGMFARLITTSSLVDEPGALYSCTAKGSLTWESADNNDHAVGGLAGRVQGGIISSCTNEATVSVTGSTDGQVMLGGVMGRGEKDDFYGQGSDVSNCTNSGTINLNGITEMAYIGGVVGYDVYGVCSTSNCSNMGTVQVGKDGYGSPINMGGVIGLATGALDDCTNSGTVQVLFKGSTTPWLYIGGVVGRTSTTSKTLTNLKHLDGGKVIINGTAYGMAIGGVIGWMRGGGAQGCQSAGDVTINEGGAYTIFEGGLIGLAGNRRYANVTEKNDGSTHFTFTDCIVASSADITTTADAFITENSTNNDNCLAVGGMFGRITEGITANNGCSSSARVNIVPVSMTSGKAQPYCIGGIVGYASVSGNAATTSGIALNGVQYTGTVTVASGSNPIYSNLNVGGIVGFAKLFKAGAPLVLTDCVNTGSITNNATTSDRKIYIGGISGRTQTTADIATIDYVRCINGSSTDSSLGTVTNNGSSGTETLSVGGVIGSADGANTSYPVNCHGCVNYSAVSNYGSSQASDPSSRVGGLAGWFDEVVIATGTGHDDPERNLNYGPVLDCSASKYPGIGGLVGYINNANTNCEYNENHGTVTFSPSGEITEGYVGGVYGHVNANAKLSDSMNYGNVATSELKTSYLFVGGILGFTYNIPGLNGSYNHGDITCTDATVTTGLHLGGVLSVCWNTSSKTYNNLNNLGAITISGLIGDGTGSKWSGVGGIMGGADTKTNKTLTNCTNTGNMNVNAGTSSVKNGPRMFIGGIAGYTTKGLTGSRCEANITCLIYHSNNTSDKSCVGGIGGYWNIASLSGLHFNGAIQTTGTSPAAYIAGIVGREGNASASYSNCSVAGSMKGAGSAPFAGLFVSSNADNTISFTGCTVKKGTVVKRGSSNTTVSSMSQFTIANSVAVASGKTPSGTLTDCSVIN